MDFRILGPLEVVDRGEKLQLSGGKQRTLLVFLLLHKGESVSTERLIDVLWGERPPASAANSVHIYVSQLRKTLGNGRLVTNGGGYALELGPDELDAGTFERLLGEGRALLAGADPEPALTMLTEALGLWRGQPLQEFAYEEFALGEIARLEELRLQATEERIDADLALGRAGAVVAELEALVRAHPLRERLRGQLMLALYRGGRQADALDVYRDGRRALADELGLEPSPALQQLERSILNHDPALDTPVEHARQPEPRSRGPTLVAIAGAALLVTVAVSATQLRGRDAGLASVAENSVGVIDPATNRIVAQVPVGATPTEIDVGEGSVWVINADDRTVSQIDPATRTLVRTFAVETTPTDVVAAFGALWVGGRDPPEVRRLDRRSGVVTQRIVFWRPPREARDDASGVKLTTGGGSLWASASGVPQDELLARIDPQTGRVTMTLRPAYAGSLAAGAGSIWMIQFGTLTRVGVVSNRAETTRRTYAPGFDGEIAADDSFVWVVDEFGDTIWQLDASSQRLLRSIQVGKRPAGVALGFGSVWVAGADGTVSRIDPTSHRVVATIRVGGVPHGIAAGAGSVWVTVG